MKLFIAGHQGMVGSALVRRYQGTPGTELILRKHSELDLCDQKQVFDFYRNEKPDTVILAAAKVGGIMANNTYPAEFIYRNLSIAANGIEGAYRSGVRRLLYLGSSCIYPRLAPQPMSEDCLLSGNLEPTNEAYAVAKITGLKLCQYYRKQYGVLFHSAMPTNLYGPGDNYNLQNSHVLAAFIRRFHEAREKKAPSIILWGTGSPKREFLHVDDLADACAFILELNNPPDWVNVGTGSEVTIQFLAGLVSKITQYEGKIGWDSNMPDGTPRKLLDVSRLAQLGWKSRINLEEGIEKTYQDYLLKEESLGKIRK